MEALVRFFGPAQGVDSSQFKASQLKSAQEAKATTIALLAVGIIVFACSFYLLGLGTSPGMMLTGVSFVPYLLGTVIGGIAIGVLAGAPLFGVKTAYHLLRAHCADKSVSLASQPS